MSAPTLEELGRLTIASHLATEVYFDKTLERDGAEKQFEAAAEMARAMDALNEAIDAHLAEAGL